MFSPSFRHIACSLLVVAQVEEQGVVVAKVLRCVRKMESEICFTERLGRTLKNQAGDRDEKQTQLFPSRDLGLLVCQS